MSFHRKNWSRRELLAAVPGIVAGVAARAEGQAGAGVRRSRGRPERSCRA